MYIVFAVKNSKSKDGKGKSAGAIIVSVISCIFTLIIVLIGVFAVIKKSRTLCLYVRRPVLLKAFVSLSFLVCNYHAYHVGLRAYSDHPLRS